MAQILQPYKVPVVFNDLSQEETLKDVIYALDSLAVTVDDIFGRINNRIADERKRVTQINHRVANCHNKVHQMKGSNRATTVFSTSKFPAPKSLPSYPTLFSQVSDSRSPYREVDEEVQYVPAHPAHTTVGNKELATEVQDIVCRMNTTGIEMERVEFLMEDHGLGRLPNSVSSVGSILLFNSDINPYEDYQTLDNLLSAGREKQVEDETGNKGLASAPTTLMSGDALPDIQALDLMFKPEMGEMSSLALPENLPLDFIANIQFQAQDLPSIAPTISRAKPDFSLPQITDGGIAMEAGAPPPAAPAAPVAPTVTAPEQAGAPPPPPPPPPPGAPQPTQQQTRAPPPPPPPVNLAPPPPPPVPIVAPTATQQQQAVEANDENIEPSPAPSGRGNFLDAIKGMSVANLRSKEESAVAAQKIQKKADQTKPLTMAEALKQRLARRNDAISGKSDAEQKRKDSLVVQMARQKSMAPNLKSMGFAAIDEGDEKDDDDEEDFKYTNRTSFLNVTVSDDSDSEASDFTDDSGSRRGPKSPAPAKASPAPPAPPKPAAPTILQPSPAPAQRRGSGLLDTSNQHLSTMLSTAMSKAVQHESDEDDDWD